MGLPACLVDVLAIHFVITLASPIDCFCTDFDLLALPWLGIAFRLRLATPLVESQFHKISWPILCYNSTFFFQFLLEIVL